jgi:hypothetical protein
MKSEEPATKLAGVGKTLSLWQYQRYKKPKLLLLNTLPIHVFQSSHKLLKESLRTKRKLEALKESILKKYHYMDRLNKKRAAPRRGAALFF